MSDKKYNFTEDWFSGNISTWVQMFNQHENKIESVLEIGAYEGKATVWLCENIPTIKRYFIIDTFEGSEVEHGMEGTSERLDIDNSFIENNLKYNISNFPNIDFFTLKGESQKILPTMNEKFDFIYIDGSHKSDDTFMDGYWSHRFLNVGGIIVFDDLGWKDPNRPQANESPEIGIRLWNTLYENYYDTIMQGYQAGFMKVK